MSSILKVDTIQNTGGTTGLTIDNSGRVSTPARPAFRAYLSGVGWRDITHNGTYKIPFDVEKYDVGGCFDTSTNSFTAPISGYYFLSITAYTHDGSGVKVLELQTGNTNVASGESIALHQASHLGTMQITAAHYFNANETCSAYFYQTNDVSTGVYSSNNTQYSNFYGFLIG